MSTVNARWNTQTGMTSWEPPAARLPPPMPPPAPSRTPVNVMTNAVPAGIPAQYEEPEEDLGPTGPSPEIQLRNLNKFLINGIIDQEEYDRQKKEIKAMMPSGPVFDPSSLQRKFTTTTLKWGALVDTRIPTGWVEGKDYTRAGKLEPGTLVGINRSDGSIRFGQVVKKGGLLWEDRWKVVVSMKDDGSPGATREEDGVMLLRPSKGAMEPVLAAMPAIKVDEKDVEALLSGSKSAGLFASMFAEPVYEGGSAPPAIPIQPTAAQAPKAVVPAGVIPRASVPAGVIPRAAVPPGIVPQTGAAPPGLVPPPAAAPPSAVPQPPQKKTSGWL